MERLTIEQIKQFSFTTYGRMLGKQLATQVMNELIEYKQIEQDLGIELSVLFNDRHFGIIVANYLKDLEFFDKYGVHIKIPSLFKEELKK